MLYNIYVVIDGGMIRCAMIISKYITIRLRAEKEKKQKVPRKNKYGRRLRRWQSVIAEYTQPSRNITA